MKACAVPPLAPHKTHSSCQQLDFVSVDIPELLTETPIGHRYVVVISDQYPKPARAISSCKFLVTQITNIFFNHCFGPYCIPTYRLLDNVSKLVNLFSAGVCTPLEAKRSATTAKHPQSNYRARRFHEKKVTHL